MYKFANEFNANYVLQSLWYVFRMLYVSRLLMGLTQAAISIYTPVWVDHFAPPSQLTLWMGLAQGGVVIGTMVCRCCCCCCW